LCLDVMKERLKKNICGLDDYVFLSEIEDLPARKSDHIGDALEYACHFWASHLGRSASSGPNVKEVFKAVDEFFTTCFIFWIEVLILTGNLDVGVHALNDIHQWYILVSYLWHLLKPAFTFIQTGVPCKWTNDSQRFLLEHFDKIHGSSSQIYHSALPFAPSSSWLCKHYSTELSKEIKVVKGLPVGWRM